MHNPYRKYLMAAKPAAGAEGAEAKPKSKKLLIIIIVLVLVLAIVGAAAAFFLLKPKAEDEEADGAAPAATAKAAAAKPKTPPQFMPLDPMVVNLADPGGARYAQIGLTLQIADASTADAIKAFMPAIRNGMLLRISKRSAEELLRPEGKEALANELLELVREQTGMPLARGYSPIEAVLFASLIVQ